MQRVNRHTGEVKAIVGQAEGAALETTTPQGEHKILGIETRVLVAAGLLGALTYAMFTYDPVPRRPKPKTSRDSLLGLSSGKKDSGFVRRQIEEEIEREVDEAENDIDEEFEHTDIDDDELEVSDDEEDGEEEEDA